MPVVVEPESESLARLLAVMPAGSHGVDSADRLQAWLVNRTEEYAVVLGPHVDLADALSLADGMRLSRPSTSVVLLRHDVDTTVLREAMQAGVRDVVPAHDEAALGAALDRAYQLYLALRGP